MRYLYHFNVVSFTILSQELHYNKNLYTRLQNGRSVEILRSKDVMLVIQIQCYQLMTWLLHQQIHFWNLVKPYLYIVKKMVTK